VLSARVPRALVVTYFKRNAAPVAFGIQSRCFSGAAETSSPGARPPASPAGPSMIEPAAISTARVRFMASSATRQFYRMRKGSGGGRRGSPRRPLT
jgi:hypothetical protein